jgi:hypothetical protein
MFWSVQREKLDARTVKVTLSAGSPLGYDEVLSLWQGDERFRRFFTEAVLDSGFEAFFWETPPVTLSTLGRPFEFVVVEGGALARLRVDPQPFAKHFAARPCPEVLSFPNLGGDATLIVPAPVSPDVACYTHLGNFLRAAPAGQVDRFWQVVGETMQQRVSASPLWLSTAGMGVSWLHLRLDSRPKYYRHRPYAVMG